VSEYFDPREQEKHRCLMPGTIGPYEGWRCDCGKAYVLERLPDRDVNPGESPYQWRRSAKHDSINYDYDRV
jgi:hypothetical protein